MSIDAEKLRLENVVVADDDAITIWYEGKPCSTIRWAQVETISIDVDSFVSGPRPCVSYWMITGANNCLRVYMEQVGADELNYRLVNLPGFNTDSLCRAKEAEAEGKSCNVECWRRSNL